MLIRTCPPFLHDSIWAGWLKRYRDFFKTKYSNGTTTISSTIHGCFNKVCVHISCKPYELLYGIHMYWSPIQHMTYNTQTSQEQNCPSTANMDIVGSNSLANMKSMMGWFTNFHTGSIFCSCNNDNFACCRNLRTGQCASVLRVLYVLPLIIHIITLRRMVGLNCQSSRFNTCRRTPFQKPCICILHTGMYNYYIERRAQPTANK